ncbi:probable metabolite transport protein CsbC [Daktulosphaira vitifoliae]|uniref:probable metabolite transport protein CsbC n=1 Tax=Daktulosphaira vitifoliae TaxID=58002 RepID=UPI0021AAB0CA|nr:probable metabolite transport protein CsbC [Daktulosphaira vitifoliae]
MIKHNGESCSIIENYQLVENSIAWIVAWYCLGSLFGGLTQNILVDLIGFKMSITFYNFSILIGWIILLRFDCVEDDMIRTIWISRSLQGFGCGGLTLLVPSYISEITDINIKSKVQVIHHVFISFGISFTYHLGVICSTFNNIIYSCLFWSILHILIVYFLPESPYYMVNKRSANEVKNVMRLIRGPFYDADECYTRLQKCTEQLRDKNTSFCEALTEKHCIKVLTIGIGLIIFQQLCGVTMLTQFMQEVVVHFGDYDETSSLTSIAVLSLSILQVVVCLAAIETVEMFGRKTLLFISSICMAITLSMLLVYHIILPKYLASDCYEDAPLFLIFSYIFSYNIGWGPIVMVVIADITTLNSMKKSTGILHGIGQIVMFIVVCLFYNDKFMSYNSVTLWFYTLCCYVSALFVCFVVRETHGKNPKRIESLLTNDCIVNSDSD